MLIGQRAAFALRPSLLAIGQRPRAAQRVLSLGLTPTRAAPGIRLFSDMGSGGSSGSENVVDKEAAAVAREARKEAKAAEKAAKAAEKAAKAAALEAALAAEAAADAVPISHLALDDPDVPAFGDYATVMSQGKSGREFVSVSDLKVASDPEATVWVRGRVATVRAKGSSCFMVLRQGTFETVQVVLFKEKGSESSKRMLKWLGSLSPESVVDIEAVRGNDDRGIFLIAGHDFLMLSLYWLCTN